MIQKFRAGGECSPPSPGSLRSLIWCNRVKDSEEQAATSKCTAKAGSQPQVTEFSPHLSSFCFSLAPRAIALHSCACDIQTLPCWPKPRPEIRVLSQLTPASGENSQICLSQTCFPEELWNTQSNKTDTAALLLSAREILMALERTQKLKHLKLSETKSLSDISEQLGISCCQTHHVPRTPSTQSSLLSNIKVASACRHLLIQTAAQGQGKSPPKGRSQPRA